MDNFFDILGPLVIGALYVLGSIFSKKEKPEDEPPATLYQPEHDYFLEDEEIQRKVQSLKSAQNVQQETRKAHSLVQVSVPPQHIDNINTYADQMNRQLKKIEATKREAARLQSKSSQWGSHAKKGTSNPRNSETMRAGQSVRSSLKNPGAARSAFIYGEVLGPPISLRKTTSVPGLSDC